MKRTIVAALVGVTSLLLAPEGRAVIPEKGAIAIFAGVGPAIPFEGDYKIGYHLEVGGEYYLSKVFGVRGTIGYARASADLPGSPGVTIGGLEASALYTSRRGAWAPFVLAGFGIHTVDPPGRGPSQRLGAHFGAGTEYFLDRRTALTGQLTGRFIGSTGGYASSLVNLTFGIKYHF
jgi:hypothetical protein